MDLPDEQVFLVNTNHRNICRYPRIDDQTYLLVEHAILEIKSDQSVSGKPGEGHTSMQNSPIHPRRLPDIEHSPHRF